MSMFYLERENTYANIYCPDCNSGYDVNWQTEYGIPISGSHKINCPNCGYIFTMCVLTQILYSVEDTGD